MKQLTGSHENRPVSHLSNIPEREPTDRISRGTGMTPYVVVALASIFTIHLVTQVRKPTRWTGRLIVWLMNKTHSALTDWGLGHIKIEKGFNILDVGCGGGRTIQKLAERAPHGKICGIDYANGSVAAARAKNAQLIKNGRVEIKQASVSQIPFGSNMFDLVTAVETHYYWPDPVKDMQEVLRVLKPGGTFIIIAENYKKTDEYQELLSKAGYQNIQSFADPRRMWLCGYGNKPQRI
jgi:SAM-dependent methyltransferase